MIQEVEAAVGMAYVRGGDSSREGRLPVTSTRDLKTAQSEEVIVATQLDDLGREQEESEGSSSEGSELPGVQGILLRASTTRCS
jgi:hypothetical protein